MADLRHDNGSARNPFHDNKNHTIHLFDARHMGMSCSPGYSWGSSLYSQQADCDFNPQSDAVSRSSRQHPSFSYSMCQDHGIPRDLGLVLASKQDIGISSPINRRACIAAFVSTLMSIGAISPANADRSYTSMQVVKLFFFIIEGALFSLPYIAEGFDQSVCTRLSGNEYISHQFKWWETQSLSWL
jgi:hypothetical protein